MYLKWDNGVERQFNIDRAQVWLTSFNGGLCEYVIVHSDFATQSSYSVDLAGWQAKMASIEILDTMT